MAKSSRSKVGKTTKPAKATAKRSSTAKRGPSSNDGAQSVRTNKTNKRTGVKKRLSIDKIVVDPEIQPRVATDVGVVKEYAERIEAGDTFEPIVVFFDGTTYWLVEGFHRLAAHKRAGRKQIDCIVILGDKLAAQWHAIPSNKGHGLRPTNEDKARAVKMAFAHPNGKKMSDRAIADFIGVSPTMVAKYRPKAEPTAKDGQSKRTGRDGRTINVAKISKSKKDASKASVKFDATTNDTTPAKKAERIDATTADLVADSTDGGTAEVTENTLDGSAAARPTVTAPVLREDDLPGVYKLILDELPEKSATLARNVNELAGKVMDPQTASARLSRIIGDLTELYDAEENLMNGED